LKLENPTIGALVAKAPFNLGVMGPMQAPSSNPSFIRQKKLKRFICAAVKRPTTPLALTNLLMTLGGMLIIVGEPCKMQLSNAHTWECFC
jgi:hypothetical protein